MAKGRAGSSLFTHIDTIEALCCLLPSALMRERLHTLSAFCSSRLLFPAILPSESVWTVLDCTGIRRQLHDTTEEFHRKFSVSCTVNETLGLGTKVHATGVAETLKVYLFLQSTL